MPVSAPLYLALAGLAAIGSLFSCTGESGVTEAPKECTPPIAVAGTDLSLTLGGLAAMDGTGSKDCDVDEDGVYELTFAWSLESVPVGSILESAQITAGDVPGKASFLPDVVGTYVAKLVVTDAEGQVSSPDLLIIEVSSSNSKPIADCGGNQTGVIGARSDVDGSASYDPENRLTEYSWSISSAPSCSTLTSGSIYNGKTAVASLVPDCQGTFVVGLVVADEVQWSDPAFCTVTVAGANQPPVADAGVSTTLSPCSPSSAELNGFGSYDPEGDPLTWRWSVLSVPAGSTVTDSSISDPSIANPTFIWDLPGDYSFQLQVFDGTSWSPPDVVTLTFQDERDNSPPTANAGDPASVDITTDCTTASYVFTCEDCPEEDVEVDGSASADVRDGDELSFEWTDPSGELNIISPSSPITTVIVPGTAATYNSPNVRTWNIYLSVEDCADSHSNSTTITYTCTGEYSP
jgi:hypothetical protein